MTPDISERTLEDAIECAPLAGRPDACPGDRLVWEGAMSGPGKAR